jgi:hypothetical protein
MREADNLSGRALPRPVASRGFHGINDAREKYRRFHRARETERRIKEVKQPFSLGIIDLNWLVTRQHSLRHCTKFHLSIPRPMIRPSASRNENLTQINSLTVAGTNRFTVSVNRQSQARHFAPFPLSSARNWGGRVCPATSRFLLDAEN